MKYILEYESFLLENLFPLEVVHDNQGRFYNVEYLDKPDTIHIKAWATSIRTNKKILASELWLTNKKHSKGSLNSKIKGNWSKIGLGFTRTAFRGRGLYFQLLWQALIYVSRTKSFANGIVSPVNTHELGLDYAEEHNHRTKEATMFWENLYNKQKIMGFGIRIRKIESKKYPKEYNYYLDNTNK